MKKKFFIGLLIFLLAAGLAFSSEQDDGSFSQATGLFGFITDINDSLGGLQYQQWFGRWGYQLEGGLFINNKTYYDLDSNYRELQDISGSLAAELLCELYTGQLYRVCDATLFAWLLGGTMITTDSNKTYANAVAGIGLGVDWVFFKHISFPWQFGFVGKFPYDPYVSMTTALGIRFRF